MSLCRLASRQSILRCSSFVNPSKAPVFFTKRSHQLQFIDRHGCHQLVTLCASRQSGREKKGHGYQNQMLSATALGLFSLTFWKKDEPAKEEANSVIPDKNIWEDFKVTLYQYQTCPFCTKTRTFLQYYQIPFEIVEVHPIFKREIKFSEKYKKVPIVTIETKDERHELQDSSLIISILSTYMRNMGKRKLAEILESYPTSEVVGEDGKTKEVVLNKYWILVQEPDRAVDVSDEDPRQTEVQWRTWTDEHLVHLISPNVYRTYMEAYQAFAHHVELGKFKGTWEGVVAKVFGSFAMWLISKKLKKKYCTSDDVRIDLYRACHEWQKALGKKKFMGGDEPNLADLSVYAVLNVMDGLVSFQDLEQYTKIKPWYLRVKNAIEVKQQTNATS